LGAQAIARPADHNEHRQHHERLRGRIDTAEEHRELVCDECGAVTHTEQTLAPIIYLNFNVTIELP